MEAEATFEFERIRFSAGRKGDEIIGSARFPYPGAGGRTEVTIDYRRAPVAGPLPTSSDPTMQRRLAAVELFRKLRREAPDTADTSLYKEVAEELQCSLSSARNWCTSFELDGAEGLKDRYTSRPRSTVHLDPAVARDACIIVAWWAFRIGGIETINGPLINQAAGLLTRTIPGLIRAHREAKNPKLLDVIAAIDAYYSYRCDRSKYPFKSFQRWADHDFTKCLTWAARRDENAGKNYTHDLQPGSLPVALGGAKPVALQTTETVLPSAVPDARTRSREARWSSNRRAPNHVADVGNMVGAPTTLTEWLKTLDDAKTRMILAAVKTGAAGGAAEQVAATINIWWDSVPESARNNIRFKLDAWHKDHPHVTPQQLAKWQANLLLAAIRMEWRTRSTTLGQVTDSITREAVVL